VTTGGFPSLYNGAAHSRNLSREPARRCSLKKVVVVLIIVLVLIAAAYVAGYWPEHRRLQEANQAMQTANQQLAKAQAVNRICRLQTRLLALMSLVEANNYGDAQKASKDFFDQVRIEATQTDRPDYKQALESVLDTRDAVTIQLAHNDPGVMTALRQSLLKLRQLVESAG
jgi:type II secretory pathway pseudopilin PulG